MLHASATQNKDLGSQAGECGISASAAFLEAEGRVPEASTDLRIVGIAARSRAGYRPATCCALLNGTSMRIIELENHCTDKRTVGSNSTLSASQSQKSA
jgi:hypothetical protein